MGANAKRPLSGAPGAGGSGFYENALKQQKQAVSNRPVTTKGSRPTPGIRDDAYFNQMRQDFIKLGNGSAESERAADEGIAAARQAQANRLSLSDIPVPSSFRRPEQRPPTSPNGITMGAGYSNRPFV